MQNNKKIVALATLMSASLYGGSHIRVHQMADAYEIAQADMQEAKFMTIKDWEI